MLNVDFLADSRLVAERGNGFMAKASAAALETNANSPVAAKANNPIIVIDNYDSFTYNLCQVDSYMLLFWLERLNLLICVFS